MVSALSCGGDGWRAASGTTLGGGVAFPAPTDSEFGREFAHLSGQFARWCLSPQGGPLIGGRRFRPFPAELLGRSSLQAGMASRTSFASFIVVRDTRSDGFIASVLPPVVHPRRDRGGEVEGSDASAVTRKLVNGASVHIRVATASLNSPMCSEAMLQQFSTTPWRPRSSFFVSA